MRIADDNFRMNTGYGRYGAAYNVVALMKNFRCCQRIQQRQSYKLRVHGVNPQSPLKVYWNTLTKLYYTIIAW
jgi:hypothetical protein